VGGGGEVEGTRDVGLKTVKVKVHVVVVLSGVLDVSISERKGFRSEQKFKWKVLQYVAVCCSVLQHVAVCCSVLPRGEFDQNIFKNNLRTISVRQTQGHTFIRPTRMHTHTRAHTHIHTHLYA